MILAVALIIIVSVYLPTLPTLFKIPTANAISIVRARPNISEYPHMEDYILEAINQVYNGTKRPEEALEEAAAKSARALKW
jgi:ABC-type glycerol-3-phosphate transport system substrate-binding protein